MFSLRLRGCEAQQTEIQGAFDRIVNRRHGRQGSTGSCYSTMLIALFSGAWRDRNLNRSVLLLPFNTVVSRHKSSPQCLITHVPYVASNLQATERYECSAAVGWIASGCAVQTIEVGLRLSLDKKSRCNFLFFFVS